jgi:ankyrin repeat protein
LALANGDATLMTLVCAIVADEEATVSGLLGASTALARARANDGATRQTAQQYYLHEIEHYLYAGDTALHIAAAAYRSKMVRKLIAKGADVGAQNRRGAQPLHYAVGGVPGSRTWNPAGAT